MHSFFHGRTLFGLVMPIILAFEKFQFSFEKKNDDFENRHSDLYVKNRHGIKLRDFAVLTMWSFVQPTSFHFVDTSRPIRPVH